MIVICVVCVMGLNVVGVDILCFNYGLLVMEVNFLLGLEGIEFIIGKDIVGIIIQYLEKNGGFYLVRMKGKG